MVIDSVDTTVLTEKGRTQLDRGWLSTILRMTMREMKAATAISRLVISRSQSNALVNRGIFCGSSSSDPVETSFPGSKEMVVDVVGRLVVDGGP